MHLRIARLGGRLLSRDPATGWSLILAPMDSFRYFELEFTWRAANEAPVSRYLDVSSPRLFPATFLARHPRATADLVNPDEKDLAFTRQLLHSLGLGHRCSLSACRIEAATPSASGYDLVTAISVVEHIPEPADVGAIERMWSCVRRGGTMIITVPCARSAFDEYLDLDEYGFQPGTGTGFWFGQRIYDEALLEERLFRTCGAPRRIEVFGERIPGTFNADRALKNAGRARLEREAYVMATAYRRFRSISELPGLGVVGLEFRKD